MIITLHPVDWLALLGHFLSLSLLAVGGAIASSLMNRRKDQG